MAPTWDPDEFGSAKGLESVSTGLGASAAGLGDSELDGVTTTGGGCGDGGEGGEASVVAAGAADVC